ncbi:MAG: hypothetical protein FWE80_02385 [Oscillospiraceae bacterium]|nr:hypothetical protein [Oscillospiraceae bacterium]
MDHYGKDCKDECIKECCKEEKKNKKIKEGIQIIREGVRDILVGLDLIADALGIEEGRPV